MVEVPEKVQEAFNELKSTYGQRLKLKFLDRKFLIFEAGRKLNKSGKKRLEKSSIGWITSNGIVILTTQISESAIFNKKDKDLGAFNYMQKAKGKQYDSKSNVISNEDIELLKALSMNSRLPLARISEITGIPANALSYRIERLERLLGIRYTLELNTNNLGFLDYMILAKFASGKPNLEAIKEDLEKNPRVQLALVTKGIYDLIIFCVAENHDVIAYLLDGIRDLEPLRRTESEWHITPIDQDYGFVPIKDKFFDILKDNVWSKKKQVNSINVANLMYREYAVLRELNENSKIGFSSIDKKYNLPAGSAKKAYNDLANEEVKNIIIRPTLIATAISKKYDGIIIANLTNKEKFAETKYSHHKYIVNEPNKIVNRFSYICDMETPDGIFYLFPVLNEGNIEKIENELSGIVKGVKFDSLIVEKAMVGNIDYRKFDNLYSVQYLVLVKRKLMASASRIDYK